MQPHKVVNEIFHAYAESVVVAQVADHIQQCFSPDWIDSHSDSLPGSGGRDRFYQSLALVPRIK